MYYKIVLSVAGVTFLSNKLIICVYICVY